MRITIAADVMERLVLRTHSPARWRAAASLGTMRLTEHGSTKELAIKHLRSSLEKQFDFLDSEGWIESFAARHHLRFDRERDLPAPRRLVVAITVNE